MKEQGRLTLHINVGEVRVTRRFAEAFELLADEAGVPPGHRVGLIVEASDRMRELKRQHFGVDADTDVIAFPTNFPELGEGVPALAGEIFIGAAMIAENARHEGWSFSEEFCFVLAHGLLHLRGWDDATAAERRAMFTEQERLLRILRGHSYDLTGLVRLESPEEAMVW